jgi:hypothetical protein
MKLKISNNPADMAKIEDALRSVNGQADRHTYSSASEIIAVANKAEQELDRLLLPKKNRAGAVATKTSGGKVHTSYKYRRIATYIEMKRGSRHWFLTYALKVEVFPDNPDRRLSIILTEEQDKIAVEAFRKSYHVQASSATAQSATASDVSAAAA